VEYWKEQHFRVSDIPFSAAIDSLRSITPCVELRRASDYEWVFCHPGTTQPAVFSFAGIFSTADNYYSGNLVPQGAKTPAGVELERKYASYRCNYTYCLETKDDSELYFLQGAMDEFMAEVPGFNVNGLPRREWQSGAGVGSTFRYWMKVPMFVRLKSGEPKPSPPSHLHRWVINADKRSRAYRANAARPEVYGLQGLHPIDIRKCDVPFLERGDAVAFSFTVAYVVGSKDWYPQLLPVDIVRV
ncbi:hypothetical protein C8Q76DRAFT_597221, partial [Earliella scabrosa]